MSTPRAPRLAASVILCRNRLDPEVYWVRRNPALPFLGGFHSFPGGGQSAADRPELFGLAAPDGEAALRLCALRELFEETAILLARGRGSAGGSSTTAGAAVPAPRAGHDFHRTLDEAGLAPDVDALVPAGRWVTPPFAPIRFDTAFYLAWAPEGLEPRLAAGELVHGEWIRPEAALDLWSAGRALLAPPTLYALRGLYAASLMVAGEETPLDLRDAADFLTGAPEAAGGRVTRIEMRPGLFLFPMQTRTIPPATHTNALLIGGPAMVLVDPGSSDPAEAGRLLEFIEHLGADGRRLSEIWLTHHHPDHIGAVPAILREIPVPVRAHPLTAERLAGQPYAVDGTLADGTVRDLPGMPGWRLRVIHTPGHAAGHIALLEERHGTLIAGDMIAGVGTIVISPPEGRMSEYIESLRRLRGVNASLLFPSHGPPTTGVAERLDGYIAHRLEREARVLAALAGGAARTVEEMLPEVYADVDPQAYPLAARSLLAHLLKLTDDGAVQRNGDRFRRRPG